MRVVTRDAELRILVCFGVGCGEGCLLFTRTSNRGGGPVMWRATEKGSKSHVFVHRERGIAALRCGGQGRCSDKCWIGIAVLAWSFRRVDRRCGSFLLVCLVALGPDRQAKSRTPG